jgi:hypothetical protein
MVFATKRFSNTYVQKFSHFVKSKLKYITISKKAWDNCKIWAKGALLKAVTMNVFVFFWCFFLGTTL